MLPDEENGVHDGDKEVLELHKLGSLISELIKEFFEGGKILEVVIGLSP